MNLKFGNSLDDDFSDLNLSSDFPNLRDPFLTDVSSNTGWLSSSLWFNDSSPLPSHEISSPPPADVVGYDTLPTSASSDSAASSASAASSDSNETFFFPVSPDFFLDLDFFSKENTEIISRIIYDDILALFLHISLSGPSKLSIVLLRYLSEKHY